MWRTLTLEQACELVTDGSHNSPKDYSGGLPMASVKDMTREGINIETCRTISKEDFQLLVKNGCQPKYGDVLIAKDGATCLDTVCVYRQKDEIVLLSSIAILRPGSELDSGFLRYYLEAPDTKAMMKSGYVSGSAIPRVVLKDFRRAPIKMPLLPEQRAIAGILGALDDKIELNRRMNRTLESMARAVFRQWFVEGEDVGDWEVVPLPEIIEVNPTRSLKKDDIAPYLDMANMPTQGHRGIEWRDRPFGSGTKFINGDTLLARITPCLENGKTAYVDFLKDGQVGWGSTEYIIFRPKPPLPPEFGYYLARSEELRNHAIINMTGTSGRQRTPASCFDNYLVSIPPKDLAMRFGEFAKSVIDKVRANDEESRTLASLRDSLLPKLMRGEVRVKDMGIK